MSTEGDAGASGDTLLRAMLALQIADREHRISSDEPRRTEVVLAEAGIALPEIAALTGRKYETVKTIVRRARAAAKKANSGRSREARTDG